MPGCVAAALYARNRLQILLIVPLIVAGIASCSSGSAKPKAHPSGSAVRSTIASFNGNGNLTTPSFTVDPGWEIQWTTQGKRFQITVTGAKNLGVVLNRTQPGGGSTFPIGSGKFALQVAAKGPWAITVINHDSK